MIGKLVLIGEAPGRTSIADRPQLALTGSSGQNICKIADWEWLDYLRYTDRRNLFYDPMPLWNFSRAFEAARALERQLEGRTIILLGAKVATAFDVLREPNYKWLHEDWANVAKVPHPSGRNRMWNDAFEMDRAHDFLHGLLK